MWSNDRFWSSKPNIITTLIICGTILLDAELAIQTIFEIQFQNSRQTSPQFKSKATIVPFFQQGYNNSKPMKHWRSILNLSSEKLFWFFEIWVFLSGPSIDFDHPNQISIQHKSFVEQSYLIMIEQLKRFLRFNFNFRTKLPLSSNLRRLMFHFSIEYLETIMHTNIAT